MRRNYIFDYNTNGTDTMTWAGTDVVVTFQLGEFAEDGSPTGAVKTDGTDYLTFVTIPLARVTATPPTVYADLSSATDFVRTAFIRFKFYDGTNTKISGWIPINFYAIQTTYFILEDLTGSIGITAWMEWKPDREL
jgi:hypothetical protein